MRYQPRLDGLRGIAVLLVFAYHATAVVPGGWVGVDVFFVLSGYLITTILRREVRLTGTVNLRRFYTRRLLRLAPAFLVTIAICIPLMVRFEAERTYPVWGVAVGVVMYAANWMQVVHPTSLGPLTHTWTLAIEEQFYLVWPLVLLVFAAGRATRKQQIAWIVSALVTLVLSRIFLAVVLTPEASWFATTSRADALLIGALLGMVTINLRGRGAAALLVASSLVILSIARFGEEFSPFMLTGGLTVAAIASAAMIVGAEQSSLGAALEWPPLVVVGRVSYGIYLYHYPIFFLSNQIELTGATAWAMKILGTAILVTLSWVFIEQPVLRLKGRVSRESAVRAT